VKSTVIGLIPALIWAIIVFALLTMPGSDIPSNDFFELIYFDKWVHAGLFGVLTLFFGYPFFQSAQPLMRLFVFAAFISIAYGVAMEFVQKYFTNTRTFDVTDILADTIGALAAFFLLKRINKKWKMRR
jgi:VanZ family protein